MRRVNMLASILGITVLGLALAGPARADSLSIGVQTNTVNLGIHIGPTPPPLVVVSAPVVVVPSAPPGPPPPVVYTASSLPYNYFVYQNSYPLYHEDRWFRGRHYDGPWTLAGLGGGGFTWSAPPDSKA